ncbi:hypothetical protein N7G274_008399 [Stereocaulon virgatum]|uniref:Uncharacterized protein n=1 Tax=Stereocaulon virgatum TaxID=373712 RepID=A0ABR3ZYU9_9LECA
MDGVTQAQTTAILPPAQMRFQDLFPAVRRQPLFRPPLTNPPSQTSTSAAPLQAAYSALEPAFPQASTKSDTTTVAVAQQDTADQRTTSKINHSIVAPAVSLATATALLIVHHRLYRLLRQR